MNPKSLLFGLAVGDALGVPVEFKSREYLKEHPVTDMQGYGTHNQPPGTWSDDSSLAFCLAESIAEGFSLEELGKKFVQWRTKGYWTPHGTVFDVGTTTDEAILQLRHGRDPLRSGCHSEQSNGNGSLMRIAPLVFYVMDKPIEQRWEIARQVSSITHGHIRSVMSCYYFLELLRAIIKAGNKWQAYHKVQESVADDWDTMELPHMETDMFYKLLMTDISLLPEDQIQSTGYVLHTLEASTWSLLTTDNYKDAVLKAVNLGYDTDTTGSVTGALAGLLYGYDSIPQEWISQLARQEDIEILAERMKKCEVFE